MTVAVPTEAARHVREFFEGEFEPGTAPASQLGDGISDSIVELAAFAEQFGLHPVPGASVTLAGELRELQFDAVSFEAEGLDLVRINGRVFVPEVIEALPDGDEELIHEAGNGRRLGRPEVEAVAEQLSDFLDECEGGSSVFDAVRLLRFLGEILAGDPLERALVGFSSLTRKCDAEGGCLVVSFEEPRQSWPLMQLLQARLMADEENPHA